MIDMIVAALRAAEASYAPNASVRKRLEQVTFVPLIGPFLSGKTTIIAAATGLDNNFGCVRSFATRPRRPDESNDSFEFLPHTEASLRRLWQQVERRELVQYTVHPTTNHIYGSRPASWHKPYMLLATMPGALANLSPLPFKRVVKIAITVEPTIWVQRLHNRHDDEPERRKRLAEGVANLTWCHAQNDVVWIDNTHATPQAVAAKLIKIVTQGARSDSHAKKLGGELLITLQTLLED